MKASIAIVVVFIAAFVAGGLLLRHKSDKPTLPPMVVHCASGIGGMAQCSEWSASDPAQEAFCQKHESPTWAQGPCPADVSNAGGTCVSVNAKHTTVVHYASGWKGRAEKGCRGHGGTFTP